MNPEPKDIQTEINELKMAQAVQAAVMAGSQATQAAAGAGATATGAAAMAGLWSTVVAAGVSLVAGLFLGILLTKK